MKVTAKEICGIAERLASNPDHKLFEKTEFEVRDPSPQDWGHGDPYRSQ
jgi:hypothetical protein